MQCQFCLAEDRNRGYAKSYATEYVNCKLHGPKIPKLLPNQYNEYGSSNVQALYNQPKLLYMHPFAN